MSKYKSKPISKNKSILIEVTHLSENNDTIETQNNKPNEEIICRQLKQKLRKSDENIISLELNCLSISKESPHLRYYYEEKGLMQFNGSIEYPNKRDSVKKSLAKICTNSQFSRTLFSLNDEKLNALKYLSKIDGLIPKQVFKSIKSFSFGTIIELNTFVEHYTSGEQNHPKLQVARDDISAHFQHDKKQLIVKFRLKTEYKGKHTKTFHYKLEYNYQTINSAIVSFDSLNTDCMKIYFTLNEPPILYKLAIDDMSATEEMEFWQQQTPVGNFNRHKPVHKRKFYKIIESNKGVHNNEVENWLKWIRSNEFSGCVPQTIGKSSVLVLEIPLIGNEEKLKDRYRDVADPYRLLYLMKRFSKIPIYFSYINQQKCFENSLINLKLIDDICQRLKYSMFAIKYAYYSVFSHTFQSSDELLVNRQTKEFNDRVIKFAKIDPKAIEETLFELSSLIDRKSIFCSINALEYLFNDFKQRNDKINENLKITDQSFNTEIKDIRRCILTPTRLLVLPPQPTLMSRFIVDSDSEYIIRLSIREDDLQGLQFSVGPEDTNRESILTKVIKEPLMKGIEIGNRLFEFLGSSSSQLRDTGMILYAKDREGRTAQSIRESIGDMSAICNNVPKYVARLGLAFSQVMTHINVDKCLTEVEDDIERGDKLNESGEQTGKPYNFSDGIGRCSMDIMERVYQKLPIECRNKPSAMQIRYGGCKGMLVRDPTLEGQRIIFRKSMSKYEANSEMLGIIKLSAPRPLHLNRPLITILEQLGVKPKVFLEMLLNNLKGLSTAMVCECAATTLLQTSSTLGIPYRRLYDSGIPFLSEPIFREIIDSVISHRITELKSKARIRIPMNCGRTVFGVLDETGTLEYGQVFVQLSEVDENNMPKDMSAFVLEEEIMVTKFPCLHPGDVRKFKAVDVKALHHIKDCIVFPQKGRRPHPDEMAGSDLDGDEYAVIFNKSPLIFDDPNEEPMIFPTSEPILLDRPATVEDILDFYCEYIVGNNVGLMASAHLARADFGRADEGKHEGIFSDVCMSLARKYAVALDYSKTGRPEKMEWTERPVMYPDFMEKFAQKRTYLSKNVLGQLYRHCDRYNLGIKTDKSLDIKIEANPIFRLKGWEKYKQSAIDAYKAYRDKVVYLLNRFGVDSEAKLLSGAFSKSTKYMTGRTETNDVHELLENMINKLFIEFKKRFNNECIKEGNSGEERAQRASAWYLIPFSDLIEDNCEKRYFGFSWTITEEICNIGRNHYKVKSNSGHNCVEMPTKLIDDYCQTEWLYIEPTIEGSITKESDRRQIVMEKRFETVEIILKAWLERQDHLFFKRKVGRKLISSMDYVLSDMARKLRRKLIQTRMDVMCGARDGSEPLKTVGHLVMSFLKHCIDEWLAIETLEENNRIVDTPLVKLGFSALISLNHFFRTRDIAHIINVGKFMVSIKANIRDETFYIPLPLPKRITDKENTEMNENISKRNETISKYVEYMVQYPDMFCEQLKRLSGAIEVYLEPYRTTTKKLQHYYLLTANGTVWSLQAIKNFIAHPSFYNTVVNSDKGWRKKNLVCRGMPDPRQELIRMNPLINNP